MGDVAFDALEDPPRLRVADTVGNEQYTLFLDSPVDPEPVPADGFTYPVSDAVRVEVEGFELEGFFRMHLWDAAGEVVAVVDSEGVTEIPPGEYSLEICLQVKTYLRFSGSAEVEADARGVRVRFDTPTEVELGARSPRMRPAHTLTTTEEPRDVMSVLSYLGEGLMTTTPMRAYPNLRGYPPEIRLGDELDVPGDIETGTQRVTVGLPAELEYLYEAAPLVFYLNANVRPGADPALFVDGERIYGFDPTSFSDEVAALLRHVFTLDCAVRTAGPYPLETVECDELADDVPHDFGELYEADQGSRLRSYLEVPLEPVARQAPEWPITVAIEPVAKNVEAIPHLVAQVAPIRAESPTRLSGTEARRAALQAFTDTGSETRASSEVFDGDASFVDIGSSDGPTDVWVGDDVPISANKLVVEGFGNRYGRTPSEDQTIDVTIVCNETWMGDEVATVEKYYGERTDLPFEVTLHEHLDRASLLAVLESKTDFLHYVGHATADGLECRDGFLDVSDASSIGVETFLLNACQSYRQAIKMVEGGAIGGIATLSDVTDDEAASVGQTAARLLNIGFPLRVALEIGRRQSVVGGQYLAVGDDSVTLVPSDSIPHNCVVETSEGGHDLGIETHQTFRIGAGGVFSPWIEGRSRSYLIGNYIGPFEVSAMELREFLQLENVPVQYDGEFRWAFDLAEELA